MKKTLLLLVLLTVAYSSCKKDGGSSKPAEKPTYFLKIKVEGKTFDFTRTGDILDLASFGALYGATNPPNPGIAITDEKVNPGVRNFTIKLPTLDKGTYVIDKSNPDGEMILSLWQNSVLTNYISYGAWTDSDLGKVTINITESSTTYLGGNFKGNIYKTKGYGDLLSVPIEGSFRVMAAPPVK